MDSKFVVKFLNGGKVITIEVSAKDEREAITKAQRLTGLGRGHYGGCYGIWKHTPGDNTWAT